MKVREDNIIVCKSFEFAVKVVDAYRYLYEVKKEFVLSKQFLRAGTSNSIIKSAKANQN